MGSATRFIVVLAALILVVRAQHDSLTTSLSNDSTTTIRSTQVVTVTSRDPVCCFVVQDTATEIWADIFSTTTYYQVVNKTSLTVRVTPFPTFTSTSIETNVYTTNATFTTSINIGQNPISLFANDAPGVVETTARYNSSQTVTAGGTLASPAAAYVYTSVRVIEVAPVTNSDGEVVCGTDFTFPTTQLDNNSGTISTFTLPDLPNTGAHITDSAYSNINSNAQAYFGGYGILGISSSALPPVPVTGTVSISTLTTTFTNLVPVKTTFYINSQFESVNVDRPRQTGVVLTFEPFVYQPESGKLGKTGVGSVGCQMSTGTEGYGYPPQTLLQSLISNPTISSQYPGLASCLPAGPSLIHPSQCSGVAPVFQGGGGDLTDSTIITITPTLPTVTALPISETSKEPPPVTSTPSPSPNPNPNPNPTPIDTSPPPVLTPGGNPPVESPTTGQTSPQVDTPSPNPPAETPTTATVIPVENNPQQPQPPTPTQSNDGGIASQIASIIGITPITQATIISLSETVPFNPASPISGSTTIVDGKTQIIVSSAATILPSLPGSTQVISGTLEVVIPAGTTVPANPNIPALTGSTIVISGSSYVIVSTPLTVPIPLPTGTSSGNTSADVPIQVSRASKTISGLRITAAGTLIGIFVILHL